MFTKKGSGTPGSCDTIIGASAAIEGDIECDGTLRFDGKLKGNLKVNGDVYIGKDAHVSGTISANNIHLSGIVEGNVQARGLLRIMASAKLFGDIGISSFVADEGAVFQGQCKMLDQPAQEEAVSKKAAEKAGSRKTGRDYKKSTVLDTADEKDKPADLSMD